MRSMEVSLKLWKGDHTGVAFPVTISSLLEAGTTFLTEALRSTGAIAPDNHVTAITNATEFIGGGQGQKLMLDVVYARSDPGLVEKLFVKFQLETGHPLRDLFVHLMAPEVRFALFSRRRDFPVRVPVCYFADSHTDTGDAILITERITYGQNGIEPPLDKCRDHQLGQPRDYYETLTRSLATLAGHHRAGHFGSEIEESLPFDLNAAKSVKLISFSRDELQQRLTTMRRFMNEFPQLMPDHLRERQFLDDFCAAAMLVQKIEPKIHETINAQEDLIALCHWNMNVDNAWFWRDSSGKLQCGMLDWGGVSQMNIAHAFFGMSCGAESVFLHAHETELMMLFLETYRACGGPRVNMAKFESCVRLATAVKGIAWMLGGFLAIYPTISSLPEPRDYRDSRIQNNFDARVNLQFWITFLDSWHRAGISSLVRTLAR